MVHTIPPVNPPWLVQRSPGGYESIGLDDPGFEDGNPLRSVLRGRELEKVMQGREIRVAIGSVSAAMGLYMVWKVWSDSYKLSRAQPRSGEKRYDFLWFLHSAEVFPLILGFNIFWSTLILVIIQSSGLRSIGVSYCKTTGAIALPAILTLGMIHFEYGLETTLRALSSTPFRKASRWRTVINLSLVAAFLLFLFIVAIKAGEAKERCFGSIGFRVSSLDVGKGVIGMLSILIFSLLVMAMIITYRLMQIVHINADERIAASRMVYYLVASAIAQVFLLPFFVQEHLRKLDSQLSASTVAEYAIFSQGAVLAFLHLILRANASKTAIRPRATPWHIRRRFRLFGRNDLHIQSISSPSTAPMPVIVEDPQEKYAEFIARQQSLKRQRSQKQRPNSPRKLEISSPIVSRSNMITPVLVGKVDQTTKTLITAKVSPTISPTNQPAYGLFPGADDVKLPSAVYTPPVRTLSKSRNSTKALPPMPRRAVPPAPSLLTTPPTPPPKPMAKRPAPLALSQLNAPSVTDVRDFAQGSNTLEPPKAPWVHRRGDSQLSSATVQIGFRMSSTDSDILPSAAYQPSALRNVTAAGPTAMLAPPAMPGSRFASGLRIQLDGAEAGRDLNSFQWMEAPRDSTQDRSQTRPRTRQPRRSVGWAQNPIEPQSAASATSAPDGSGARRWV